MKPFGVACALLLAGLYLAGWLWLFGGDERPPVYLCCGFLGAVLMIKEEGRAK